MYFVRVGAGFDLYLTDTTGNIAHNPNIPTALQKITESNGLPLWNGESWPSPTHLWRDMGTAGAGMGVYPLALPANISLLFGTTDPNSDNFGNYIYSDGSIITWNPKGYYRIGHADSPRYAVYGNNAMDIRYDFPDEATANADGYVLDRAFIDGGQIRPGFWYDKYVNSKSTDGLTHGRSVKNGVPISLTTTTTYTRSQGMTGCTGILADAVVLSRARGAGFNAKTIFQESWLAKVALAQAQYSTSTTHCAWYDAAGTTNFPKGCNNGALRDVNDTSILFVTAGDAGASAKPLAGSANQFAKTTHNGQNCGIADLNGTMWEVALGVTFWGSSATSATQILNGNSYVLKPSISVSSLTGGWNTGTDAWGNEAHILGLYDLVEDYLPFGATQGSYVYFGNGTNRVFDPAASGAGYLRTAAGVQQNNDATSATGTNLFGGDGCYRHNRHNLFPLCGGAWSDGSLAGVFARSWSGHRSNASHNIGFRASAYVL